MSERSPNSTEPTISHEAFNRLMEERNLLINRLRKLESTAPEKRREILQQYKSGVIDLVGYKAQIEECEAPIIGLNKDIRNVEKEIRLEYANILNAKYLPDEKRRYVESLDLANNLDSKFGDNIQAGGSNAKGVHEIIGTDLLAIEKSLETYEFIAALPALMQNLKGIPRIPRVLSVFQTGDRTYQVIEKASGRQVDSMSTEEIAKIPQEHFDELISDISKLNEIGIQIDPSKTSNLFYDLSLGFRPIDLGYPDPFLERGAKQLDILTIKAALIGGKNDQTITEKIQAALQKLNG